MMIHNGDHAAFEIEHANTKPQDRPDWPPPSFDANDWAQAFMNTFNGEEAIRIDLDLMRAWFANALMRGYDEGRASLGKEVKP